MKSIKLKLLAVVLCFVPTVFPRSYIPIVELDTNASERLEAHQQVAEQKAINYYRYEHQLGSNSVTVQSVTLDDVECAPIEGWSGRRRTQGRALVEFYDSKGRSFSRAVFSFEVITEEKAGGSVKVVDFTHKG